MRNCFPIGLRNFCSSFYPSLGLSSCVPEVVAHFLQSMTDLHLQHLFRLSLRYDTGVFIYQGQSTTCQYYEMVLLKNVMQSKNSRANIFDTLALRIRLAFFIIFKILQKESKRH